MINNAIVRLGIDSWSAALSEDELSAVLSALEQGEVLYLPRLAFTLQPDEMRLLDPAMVNPKRKNISLKPLTGEISGVADAVDTPMIKAMIERFYHDTQLLIAGLLPHYRSTLHSPTSSLRLHPVAQWRAGASWRKDDSRLHIDAFPSRPNYGERILRIFTNINPHGENRQWRVGESFPNLAQRFLPRLAPYSPLKARVMSILGITKRYRSHYDHLMLQIHDRMKADSDYQQNGAQQAVAFPPGSTWICFSDQTPHAAMGGQFMLEQTYLLPVKAMAQPEYAPLSVLQNLTGRTLI